MQTITSGGTFDDTRRLMESLGPQGRAAHQHFYVSRRAGPGRPGVDDRAGVHRGQVADPAGRARDRRRHRAGAADVGRAASI